MDEQYKPNSNKYKKEQAEENQLETKKKVEKIVTTTAVKRKNGVRKFADTFISEDAANVKSYVVSEVLIPALKKAISDIVTDGIDMILYGGSGKSRQNNTRTSYISYRNYSDPRDKKYSYREPSRSTNTGYSYREPSRSTNTGYSYDDIILSTRSEAEEVILAMSELVEAYGVASIADLYDLVGVSGNFTDNKYGWTNVRNAEVVHTRDGYLLKFPRARLID